ncbi:hypothetical protein [Anaerotignum sp.]|uniref:hypothetical protein n=1 Tax=Anaerotignum sp. TaxID=2039241 RepID=UPI0028B113A8|nr:hypothetical protein [Anaerotignum sp.]
MEEKKSAALRQEVNQKLKEEFDAIHEKIMKGIDRGNALNPDAYGKLVEIQISLASQIVREERSLKGEGAYALPPYTTSSCN